LSAQSYFDYSRPLLEGALTTLKIAVSSELVAIGIGLTIGPLLLSSWAPLRALCRSYVELFRGISALIQLYFLYYILPQIGLMFDPFTVAIFGLGLNSGAYCAEFIRGAIVAVPKGQIEAAASLGLGRFTAFRHIILPQAVFRALPPLGNMSIDLLKLTSIVSFITIPDLTFVAYQINQSTFDTLSLFSTVLLFYFVVAQGLAYCFRLAERHFGRGLVLVSTRR
jgi:polar amino acid transport system permease protein